jgi:hypothetical protein
VLLYIFSRFKTFLAISDMICYKLPQQRAGYHLVQNSYEGNIHTRIILESADEPQERSPSRLEIKGMGGGHKQRK